MIYTILVTIILGLTFYIITLLQEKKDLKKHTDYLLNMKYIDQLEIDRNKKILSKLVSSFREKLLNKNLEKYNENYIIYSLERISESLCTYDIFGGINGEYLKNTPLEDYKYIYPERVLKICEEIYDKNPSRKELTKIFEDIDEEYRKLIFSTTKKIINIMKNETDKEQGLLLLYTEKNLVEEGINLFETEFIKIQFAGDKIPQDTHRLCFYV